MRSLQLCFALSLVAASADGAVWFVDKDNVSGVEDGLSWETAFTTIQLAIDSASTDGGGDVWIAEGVYDEMRTSIMHDPPTDTGSLVLKDNVRLFGGFAGSEIDLAQRNLSANPVVIDGSRSLGGESALHVVVGAVGAVLDGLTIQGGRASDDFGSASDRQNGAGLFTERGPLEIRNSEFRSNDAPRGSGSAIFTRHRMDIENSRFLSNLESVAISVAGVTITIDKCVFRDNAGGAVGAGGNFGNIFISDSLIESNGRGLGVSGGVLLCDRTVFVGNRSTAPLGPAAGAVTIGNGADATITNSVFYDNRSEAVTGVNIAVRSSAGAIATFNDADLTVINSTFWGNTSASGVGAIDSAGDFDDVLVVVNSIFWNNDETPIRARPEAPLFHTANVAFSDVEGGFDGQGNIDADPLFVDPANGDFRVQAGSPIIDTGTAQVFGVTAPGDDILGVPRPFGAEVDMGAYEFQGELQLCALFPDISQQFEQFLADFGLMEIDPGDGLPATGSLALIETASCFLDESLTQATDSAFLTNRAALMTEPDFSDLMPYEDLIPALMLASTEMQAAVRSILSGAGLNLTGDYFTVRCSSSEICTTAPPAIPKGPVTPAPDHEPYSGSGDPDRDGLTNAEEWDQIVVINGGTPTVFARAALGITSSGGSSSSCFIATAVYGTPLTNEIQPLRTFRDNHLLTNPLGAALTDLYYRLSPPLADRIAHAPSLRRTIRRVLNGLR